MGVVFLLNLIAEMCGAEYGSGGSYHLCFRVNVDLFVNHTSRL